MVYKDQPVEITASYDEWDDDKICTGFLRRKFASSQDSTEFGQHVTSEDFSRRSLLVPSPGDFSRSEFDETRLSPQPPPAQSALLDVFRNTSDRRPSAAGFLRRPSAVNFHRRPSTVVELKYVPSSIEQEFIPNNPAAAAHNYNRPQQQPLLNLQQVVDDHHNHYYQTNPESDSNPRGKKKKKPGIDLTELSKIYGIPLSRPLTMDDDEGSSSFLPQRRSTMPNVLDGSTDTEGSSGEGFVRTGSLYSATRKMEAQSKNSSIASVRKNSLPDISSIGASDSKLLSREAIAILSSQRREAIRRQEEEAMRLRANPLLYLFSPEIWDWLASQQLVILIIVINVALGILFFKVIL
ncbi:uncharacterized protein LOC129223249 [Uloborus diversus]|uniref:uncharacterized protein LOC129223249 n=1 Tax=Uloborus diversus TaxID=327109 RepID=UPI00240A5540|nr:uncharacterized protein LOC129223249 [Uloborus diversus]